MAAVNPESLSRWYDACGAQLRLYARQWLGGAEAQDVVQEVFIRLMTQPTEPQNVKAWLFRAVRNTAISQLRRRKRRQKYTEQLALEQPGWFEPRPGDLIDAETAQKVLQTLPSEQRELVVLRIWGQMTLKEVAQITDQPISTVFSRYQAALEAIKKKMETSCKTKKN
ncbi:RNA polymerase sigma factor [Planctomycetota bacterium]